jgi:hypothetical protein
MTTHDDSTRPVPPAAPAAGTTPPPGGPAVTTTDEAPARPEPTYLSGPAPFPVLLGILGLLTALGVLVAEWTDLSVPWTDLGPWTIVVVGLVVLVVGAVGLRSSRRRD